MHFFSPFPTLKSVHNLLFHLLQLQPLPSPPILRFLFEPGQPTPTLQEEKSLKKQKSPNSLSFCYIFWLQVESIPKIIQTVRVLKPCIVLRFSSPKTATKKAPPLPHPSSITILVITTLLLLFSSSDSTC